MDGLFRRNLGADDGFRRANARSAKVDLCLGEVDGEGIVLFKKLVDAAKSPSCITVSLIM